MDGDAFFAWVPHASVAAPQTTTSGGTQEEESHRKDALTSDNSDNLSELDAQHDDADLVAEITLSVATPVAASKFSDILYQRAGVSEYHRLG